MNILIFDTETTSLDKPFCYNLGYIIYDTDNDAYLEGKQFVVEQVWHNNELFSTAYYAEKREKYVEQMRAHKAEMTKWGYAMREMMNDIKKNEVTACYAFNSNFDDRVFKFNCDWFKTLNPLDNIPVLDIWGYSSQFITNTAEYRQFCEDEGLINDNGNYIGNAEAVMRFIGCDKQFIEEHMAFEDCIIETLILIECVKRGANWNETYAVARRLNRETEKPLKIMVDGKILFNGTFIRKWHKGDDYRFITTNE